jgi:hypothetical protein
LFNVCPGCGLYSVERAIESAEPVAICPHCGFRQPFRRLPLFVVTGASGSGKSAITLLLPERLPECVVLESDILWRPEFDRPSTNWRDFHDVWLRLVKNIAQSGRPVDLSGTALPDQLEACPERRYIGDIHYLALVCDDDCLAERLRHRPAWRGVDAGFIDRMLEFNRWLKANARSTSPSLTLLDTSARSVEECADWVGSWVRARLPAGPVDLSRDN